MPRSLAATADDHDPVTRGQDVTDFDISDATAQEPGYKHKSLSPAANEFLTRCPWPGNVRQLHNVLVRAAVLADRDTIELADLEVAVGSAAAPPGERTLEQPLGNGFNLDSHLDEIRRYFLRRALGEAKGNKSKATKLLGLKHYQTLAAQLERLGVEWASAEVES
jgi:DNA-binding NtrC family response regulator